MGRYYCNGKKGYCDRFVGNFQNAENIDCKDCEYADGSGGEYKDVVTNYDRIKSMSVEEMEEFIENIVGTADCQNCPAYELCELGMECEDVIKQWLLQEVSDD